MPILTIPGTPIALKRPRMSGKIVYDSQAVEKQGLRWVIKSQWIQSPLEGPVALEIEFRFPIPKSWSKKKREEILTLPHTSTPDLDNLVKWVCDLFNNIVFKDDKQVWNVKCKKVYADKAETIISIETPLLQCSKGEGAR